MEKLGRIVEHEGVVTKVGSNSVTVTIKSVSACASCAAHAKCGFAESKDKTLEIPFGAGEKWKSGKVEESLNVGDRVTVCIDTNSGMRAVWIAYLFPAILIIGVVIGLTAAGLPEGLVALSAFGALALHILVLYILRKNIDRRFQITIRPC